MKRDVDLEKLSDLLDRDQTKQEYKFQIEKILEQPIYKANKFRMDIYQQKWEEAFTGMLKYLYDKVKADFYMQIDVHKMFRNIEIPHAKELVPLKYYIDQLVKMIGELRVQLYELKMNSMCRIKMPITANTEVVEKIKNIYLLHIIIDNLMGDRLKYDQYIFIYNSLRFIFDSTQRDYLLHLKDDNFIKNAIPKHVILNALIYMTNIVQKLREKAKDNGEEFSYNNYIQINKPLEPIEALILNAHEIENIKLTEENKKARELLLREVDEIGRFWILENYISPDDRALWIEAVEALRNINYSVQNDIRDMLLTQFDESKKVLNESKSKEGNSKRTSRDNLKIVSQKSLNNSNRKGSVSKGKGLVSAKKKSNQKEKEEKLDQSYETDDDNSILKKAKDKELNLDKFRPPYNWNFPYEKLKKQNEEERIELRLNDPRTFYKDGRIEKFLALLNEIKKRMIMYKGGLWDYTLGKIMPIFVYLNNSNILPKMG